MPIMDLNSEKEEGCAGITTFRNKYPNQASFGSRHGNMVQHIYTKEK
jgi:hypothetical protein